MNVSLPDPSGRGGAETRAMQPTQFSLGRLLVWVAAAGVVLALWRWQRVANPLPRSVRWQAVVVTETARLWWNSVTVLQLLATVWARRSLAAPAELHRWRQAVGFGMIPFLSYLTIFVLMVSATPGGVASRVLANLTGFLVLAQLINAALAWVAFRTPAEDRRVEVFRWIVLVNSLTPVAFQCCLA